MLSDEEESVAGTVSEKDIDDAKVEEEEESDEFSYPKCRRSKGND